METLATAKASGRKSNRKEDGKKASGSSRIKGRRDWRKVSYENKRDRIEVGEDKSKAESSMGSMEVEKAKALFPSPVQPTNSVKEAVSKVRFISEGNWDFLCTDKEDEAWATWQDNIAEAAKTTTVPEPKRKESMEERQARREERRKANLEKFGSDYQALLASQFRSDWNFVWSHRYGSFQDTTRIPPMRYTDKPAPDYRATTLDTLQIFSAKVAELRGCLQWPLDVFGLVAIRDPIDHNRNIIFYRTRENCQTITEKDRNLVLVGPSRAVVFLMPHPVIIEVDLKVKGTTESDDEDLSFLAVPVICNNSLYSRLLNCAYTSKSSTLEFALGSIVSSVEATVSVSIISGSWPDGFHSQIAVFTAGTSDKNAESTDYKEIVLLDSRGEQVLVTDDGKIKLSRRVVSVEISGKLTVSVKAWRPENSVVKKEAIFTPLKRGLSDWTLHIGSCKMEVSVAWSLISAEPFRANSEL